MDILYLLIPLSVLVVLGLMAVFGWALHAGQFDDLQQEGERILRPDTPDRPDDPGFDRHQARD